MKVFIILLCIGLGLAGLFMSACGGIFLLTDLTGSNGNQGLWIIAAPCLLLGVGCVWLAIAGIRRAARKDGSGSV